MTSADHPDTNQPLSLDGSISSSKRDRSSSGHGAPSPGTTTSAAVANASNPFITHKRNSDPTNSRQVRKLSSTSQVQPLGLSASKNPFHKLLHNNHEKHQDDNHGVRNRAKSLLHLKGSNTAHHPSLPPPPHPHHPKTLKRASTTSHTNLAAKDETILASGACVVPPRKHEKIVFNPYGINNGPRVGLPQDHSFYLEESDVKNLLPMPIENPNDHLPADMKQLQVDLTDFYEIPEKSKTKLIGDGASSDVRVINEIGNKQKKYALKKLLLFKGETPEHFYSRVVAEFVIAKNVSNGFHIVTTLELLRVSTTGGIYRGWGITMEYCEGGDLFSLATNPGWRSVAREDKFCIFKQIAFGIKFLHEKDIAHIDLKPENVLLTKSGVVKLTDFGISRFAHKEVGDFDSEINYITRPVGSAPYSPPEMMELDKNKSTLVEPFKVDMWALGVLLSVLFYSKLPFNEASNKDEAYRKYLLSLTSFESKYNPGMKTIGVGPGTDYQLAEKFHSKEASYMCWRLMDPSDTRRYTLEQLFSDPFFVKITTCTDEFTHLTDLEDELCNHDHVFELKNQINYSSVNSSNESLHKPVKSMLDFLLVPQTNLSRSSSTSSTSTTTSSIASLKITGDHQQPQTNSPVRSMLDPLPRPTQSQVPSSAYLERRKSYDKVGRLNSMLRSSSGSSIKGGDGVDIPIKVNGTSIVIDDTQQGQQQQQVPLASELPVLEEDTGERTNDEAEIVKADEQSPTLVSDGSTTIVSDQYDDSKTGSHNESVISLPRQRIFRDTNAGDNDALQIDKEHGLVETHCLISDETLRKCCCFDSRIRHKHSF